MKVVKYNPLSDLHKVERDLDKFWENGWGLLPSHTDTTAMDMYEENGKLIAEVSLPNFKKDEVKVTTDEGVLEVSAEHQEKEEDKSKRRYYFHESSNRYLRRVTLPEDVKADKAEAVYKDGVLRISIPMSASIKKSVKTVPVK
jgi:HSP20 family protein